MMFDAITLGSSQSDSMKKTWAEERQDFRRDMLGCLPFPVAAATPTLKSFSSPNWRIKSRLSLVVLVASKT